MIGIKGLTSPPMRPSPDSTVASCETAPSSPTMITRCLDDVCVGWVIDDSGARNDEEWVALCCSMCVRPAQLYRVGMRVSVLNESDYND